MPKTGSAVKVLFGAGMLVLGIPEISGAIELQKATVNAWNDYVRAADARLQARADGNRPFLWVDEAPGRTSRLQLGEVVIAPVVGHGSKGVPGGLIHDWIGAVFIPGANIDALLDTVHDYGRYRDIYRPAVADSRVLACRGPEQKFSMVWTKHILFVDAAVEGDYDARDTLLESGRGYSVARTARMREIEDYGKSGEHYLPPGEGNGFLWRIESIARFEARDGGVYLELEAIALTRDIPLSLRPLVNPIVNRISVSSLTTTLLQTRDAVRIRLAQPEEAVSCAPGRNGTRRGD
jgi:hypothetical protein